MSAPTDTTPAAPAKRRSKAMTIAGWVLGVIPCLLLIFSGVMKLRSTPEVVEGFTHLGWPARLSLPLGILEIGCTLVYLLPRTAVLGAVLLTGYMGGAIATHVRIDEPFYTQTAVGVVLWLGLFLRDARLRAILPLR